MVTTAHVPGGWRRLRVAPAVGWRTPTLALVALAMICATLGAQARARTVGTVRDPAFGTKVVVEAVKSADTLPPAIVITVANPAKPAVIRLPIPRAASLALLSDSVLALPAHVMPGQSLYFPIYTFPLDSGSTLTTARFVSDKGDLMQVQVNTPATSAVAVLSRKTAEGFVRVLHRAVAVAGAM